MTTDNPPSAPVQPSQYNSMQSSQVIATDPCHCLNCSLFFIPMQALGGQTSRGLDHELWSNGHLAPSIDSAVPHPAMHYVNAIPPTTTTYLSNMGYDDPPRLATVRVYLRSFMSHLLTIESPKGPIEQQWNQGQRQSGGYPTPRITQRITPGPPLFEQHPPVIPVRILFLRPLPSHRFLSLLAHTAVLTALLATGGVQQLPQQSCSSSSQYSRAVSSKSQHCALWNDGWRRSQESGDSIPAQPWLTCRQVSDEAKPIRCR